MELKIGYFMASVWRLNVLVKGSGAKKMTKTSIVPKSYQLANKVVPDTCHSDVYVVSV